MQKELNLDQAIAEISRRLKRHIGSNGTAHLPVSKDFAGFMTPEMLNQHNELFVKRIRVPDGTDILSLKPGYYEGSRFLNHPLQPSTKTTWLSNVDVKFSDNGRKQFKIIDNMTGAVWERTIHSGGDPASGSQDWARVYREQTLWKGNSKLADPVSLALPLAYDDGGLRYAMIKVVYQTEYGNYGWAVGTSNGVTINASNVNNDSTDEVTTVNISEAQMYFNNAKTAYLSYNRSIAIYTTSDSSNPKMSIEDSVINVREIIGVV